MSRAVIYLIVSIITLSLLVSAGPTLVALANAAVGLIVAIGIVAGLLRLIWYFTDRY